MILQRVIKLTHAMVDVISTNGHLNAALLAMELSQMAVQAMWPQQSPLLQLPGFDTELVEKCKQARVEDISDFMNMEDDARTALLQVPAEQMERLANVCNRCPVVELSYETDKADARSGDRIGVYEPDETVNLTVTVTRDEEEGDQEALEVFAQPVFAQYFPEKKSEEWWVVVGHSKSGKLLDIKKITSFKATRSVQANLSFQLEGGDIVRDGVAELKIYLMCDSYIGCDL